MSSFETLKKLYGEEIEILTQQIEILGHEGFSTLDLAKRLRKLEDCLTYWTDNSDTIFSLTQASQALGFPLTEEQGYAETSVKRSSGL